MKIFFIHPNFPGQYKHLAKYFSADKKNEVSALFRYTNPPIDGVNNVIYKIRGKAHDTTHRYLRSFEDAVYAGQAMWRVCDSLKKQGKVPDVICAHPGWGDGLFLKDIFPDIPLINYAEFYYHAFGADVGFDPKEEVQPDVIASTRIRNAPHILNLEACDKALTATKWQKSLFPKELQKKITVLHEGIDTDIVKPKKGDKLTLPDGTVLKPEDEIITNVERNFEPYRGFPTVMRALEIILKERPNAHVLMVGADGVSYGGKPRDAKTWREKMLKEVKLDEKRVHWLGKLPYDQYLKVLQYSSAHIYLTVPFVLSWSMLEAMSAGCLVIGSATKPVQEVIEDGKNGLLVDFFSHEDVAKRVSEVLDHKDRMQKIRQAARKTIEERYALRDLLPKHIELIKSVI